MTDEKPKDFLLTPEIVESWRCEYSELKVKQREITTRLRTLERMVEAAEVIIGALAAEPGP